MSDPSGSVIVCDRAKVSVVPDDLSLPLAAALAGRLAFVSSVILNALPSKGCRFAIVHAGDYSAASATTYASLLAAGFEVLVTLTSGTTTPDHVKSGKVYISMDHRSWVEAAREQAPNGVDLVFNFDTDTSVAMETMHIMAVNGTLIQIVGDPPVRMRRGQRYISVDWPGMVEKGSLLSCFEDILPAVRDSLISSIVTFELGQLSDAHENALSASPNNVTLLTLERIDPELPVTKGGVINGTSAFNPRASYVLIGGVGGLGISIATYMVENGARHIVLTSRFGEKVCTS